MAKSSKLKASRRGFIELNERAFRRMLDGIVDELNEEIGEEGKVYLGGHTNKFGPIYYDIKQKRGFLKRKWLVIFRELIPHRFFQTQLSQMGVECYIHSPEIVGVVESRVNEYARSHRIENVNIEHTF